MELVGKANSFEPQPSGEHSSRLECAIGKHTSALMRIFCPDQGFVGDASHQLNEETRRLLRFRLFVVGILLSIAVLLFSIRGLLLDSVVSLTKFVAFPILLTCVFILIRKKDIKLRSLRWVEFIIFGSITLHLIVFHLTSIYREGTDAALGPVALYRTAMSFFAIIVVHGFFIPSNWKKAAFAASAIALTPIASLSYTYFAHPEIRESLNRILTLEHVSYTGLIIFIGSLASVIGSHIIEMMRSRTHKIQETGMYQLKEVIGTGGMGEIWKAEHRLLARPAAIKLIRPQILGSKSLSEMENLRARFKREAQITASLRSPHTIELYDFGVTQNGSFYYVMEYLKGLDLDHLVSRFGPLPPGRVIHLMRQAADSLAEAHKRGLIHRDIKPSNLFITRLGLEPDFLKVLDFGLVKRDSSVLDDESKLTNEGITTGTPAYMAPELALGKSEVDSRSDIYALGCVGYWLLTGQLVFEGATPMEMVVEHVKTPPVPPSERTEVEIPPQLDDLIMACLSKDPDSRPQSMLEVVRLLEECKCPQPWTRDKADSWWSTHLPNVA